MKSIKEYISTAEGTMQMWDDINEILDDFDFKTVAKAMKAVGWRWAVPEGEIDDLIKKGRNVSVSESNPDYALYQPEVDDIRKRGRKMLLDVVNDAAENGEKEYYSNTGGFESSVSVLDDETRKRVFGEDAPDDFKHSVELRLRFIIEDNLPKSW